LNAPHSLFVFVKSGLLVMPQIIVAAAGALSLYYAFRWFRRESDRVEASFRRAERRIRRPQRSVPVTPLAFDAETGFYRPVE
jgi:hypothetical protein